MEKTLFPRDVDRVVDVLDRIELLLVEETDASRALWAILTALRGPDDNDDDDGDLLKIRTTSPLRSRAFPRLWNALKQSSDDRMNGAIFGPPFAFSLKTSDLDRVSPHFVEHARNAALWLLALGR